MVEYIETPLLDGLKDYSAYVRRAAVLGCVKIHKMNAQFIASKCWGVFHKANLKTLLKGERVGHARFSSGFTFYHFSKHKTVLYLFTQ